MKCLNLPGTKLRNTKSSGMTLLELLVAIAIFVIIAGAGYTGLRQGTAFEKHLKEKRRFWQRIESVYTLMQTDLDQTSMLIPRKQGLPVPAFIGNENSDGFADGLLIRFTREVNNLFRAGPVSPYQRIAYRLEKGTLYRAVRTRIDVRNSIDTYETPVLDNIKSVQLRYLVSNNRWVTHWSREISAGDLTAIPNAVELNLETSVYGSYKWLFHVGPPK